MNAGSSRITLRIGDDLRALIDAAVDKRNNGSITKKHWKLTDYCIQAILDKLNHDRRSCEAEERVVQEIVAPNTPRIITEEIR